MVKPTQDLGRWDRPVRVIVGCLLLFVGVFKALTAPVGYPSSDPRSNAVAWVLFATFLGALGLLSIATGVYEPLRRASMGLGNGRLGWLSGLLATGISGVVAGAVMAALGFAFELPLLILIGAVSAALTIGSVVLRRS
jgi:hypothetical protein